MPPESVLAHALKRKHKESKVDALSVLLTSPPCSVFCSLTSHADDVMCLQVIHLAMGGHIDALTSLLNLSPHLVVMRNKVNQRQ